MLLGAHVSIAGGLDKAIDRGVDLGANCIQTFASSPRTLKFKPVDDEIIEKYLQKKAASNIKLHAFHGIYLINLANEKPDLVDRAIESLTEYQQLAGKIGGLGTVFHIGSHKGKGLDAVIEQVADGIVRVLANTPDNVVLMLENAAGHKGTIGQTFEELEQVMEAVDKQGGNMNKLGVCIDTQHAFVSGYDLRKDEGIDRMLEELDNRIGLEKVKLVHLNDSKTEFASKRDRHENLGEGEIGTEAFECLLKKKELQELPFILEVPGENKSGPRKKDIQNLEKIASKG